MNKPRNVTQSILGLRHSSPPTVIRDECNDMHIYGIDVSIKRGDDTA